MQLDTLFAQLHNLPNVPEVAQVLIRQFDDPNTSIETLSRTVSRDPVIAAKVLRLANSARFRGARESTSIEDAALRLGFNTLRTLGLRRRLQGRTRFRSASLLVQQLPGRQPVQAAGQAGRPGPGNRLYLRHAA